MQEKHWVLEMMISMAVLEIQYLVFLEEFFSGISHKKSMPVVNGISKLKDEDGVGSLLVENLSQLIRCSAITIKAIVVGDSLQHLELNKSL